MEQQSTMPQTQHSIMQNKISSFSDLLSKTIEMFKERFWKFIGMSFIPLLGIMPLAVVLLLYYISSKFLNGGSLLIINIILGLLGIAGVILFIYISIASQAGIFILIKNFGLNQNIKEAFNEARKLVWKFFVVNIIIAIFVFLWFLLFIIPGIIFAVYYSFSLYALIFENKESTSALKRSKELVKKYWWPVAGRYILFSVVVLAPLFVLSIPLFLMEEGSIAYNIYDVILQVYQIIIGIAYVIYGYLIYTDLVKIKGQKAENI